jgi:hypothetical protein
MTTHTKNKNNDAHDNHDKINTLMSNIYMETPSGISGGTFRSNTWIIRPMNKISGNASVTLNTTDNTFTLAKGIYYIKCTAPAFNVGLHQTRLFNVTNHVTAKYGISALALNGENSLSVLSYYTGKLNVPTTFRLEHRCQTTQNSNGLGLISGFPSDEIHPHMEIHGDIEILQLE